MAGKKYTCADYREEMVLIGLRKRLREPGLPEAEKKTIQKEIRALERKMGLE